MKYKLISRIANGFGNQMFIYAASFSIAKKINKNLLIDINSGINNDKRKIKANKFKHYEPRYELGIFNLSAEIAEDNFCFNTFFKDIKRKILKFIDLFVKKKRFILENKNTNKKTFYDQKIFNKNFNDVVYLEGYFETEKYFIEHRSEIINEFTYKNEAKCFNEYIQNIANNNSISLCFRSDRYTEKVNDDKDSIKLNKTKLFEKDQYDFILRSVDYFEKNLDKPKFFLFSDNFTNLDKLFPADKFFFIKEHVKDKVVEDFLLMCKCKHYAVAPTSYHWWAAWLNQRKNKICLRPKYINPSNNLDFWPESWRPI